MCKRVQCNLCQKPSYTGCGKHVEQVLGDVAPNDRCQCRAQPRGPEEVAANRALSAADPA